MPAPFVDLIRKYNIPAAAAERGQKVELPQQALDDYIGFCLEYISRCMDIGELHATTDPFIPEEVALRYAERFFCLNDLEFEEQELEDVRHWCMVHQLNPKDFPQKDRGKERAKLSKEELRPQKKYWEGCEKERPHASLYMRIQRSIHRIGTGFVRKRDLRKCLNNLATQREGLDSIDNRVDGDMFDNELSSLPSVGEEPEAYSSGYSSGEQGKDKKLPSGMARKYVLQSLEEMELPTLSSLVKHLQAKYSLSPFTARFTIYKMVKNGEIYKEHWQGGRCSLTPLDTMEKSGWISQQNPVQKTLPHHQKIRQALQHLEAARWGEIMKYVGEMYPGTNLNSAGHEIYKMKARGEILQDEETGKYRNRIEQKVATEGIDLF